ncbi:hypothetical protein DH2020_010561 [Rehmannia glutinosa]|uniref:pyruvate kinase n=1 Tax=Rehmannia glutinosa TaxID=99300 RepID=A0ABR0XAX7_REHGL
MTKIVGTLGPNSRSVEVISGCLKAGMSGDLLNSFSFLEMFVFSLILLSYTVKKGDDIFIGQYLFTGSETTSVWLEVSEVKENDVVCLIKNSATLAGPLYTLHVSQIRIDLPTLTDKDKEVISTWGLRNKIDFLSLSYARRAEDVRHGLIHFDEILQEADGIILIAWKSRNRSTTREAVVTRVVDSMTDNLRPTRAEATDVANAVLSMVSFPFDVDILVSCSDAILLGAETLRGLYPVETISTVGKICAEAEKVYNQDLYFKKTVKFVGEPMTHLESIASSAVRAAIKVKASVIICFTSSGRAARLIAKYRPTMPVLSVVIPRLKTNQLGWTFTGSFEARQSLIVRGLFPMLADPRHPHSESRRGSANTSHAPYCRPRSGANAPSSRPKVALDHGKACGVVKPHDRTLLPETWRASVVKIIELED